MIAIIKILEVIVMLMDQVRNMHGSIKNKKKINEEYELLYQIMDNINSLKIIYEGDEDEINHAA